MATYGGRSWPRREITSNGCLPVRFDEVNVCHTSGYITKRNMKYTSLSHASQQRVANSNSFYGSCNPTALFIFVLAGSQLAVSASSDSNMASAGNVLPTLSQQQQQPEFPRPSEATLPSADRVRRRPAHETASGPPAATPPSAALMIINGSVYMIETCLSNEHRVPVRRDPMRSDATPLQSLQATTKLTVGVEDSPTTQVHALATGLRRFCADQRAACAADVLIRSLSGIDDQRNTCD
jgi:hypothetical protein